MTNGTNREAPLPPGDLITRRRLLRAAGIGAGALAAHPVLAACSTGTPTDDDSLAPGASSTNTLRLSMFGRFNGLDPAATPGQATLGLCDYIYEQLYRWDRFTRSDTPVPELATEMPREINPTTYRLSLREGVTFHDGGPLTADDVVFSIERLQDPEQSIAFRRQFLTMITDVRAINSNEVELTLSAPTTLLADRLALVHVLSKSAVEASDAALEMEPVGSGPYHVVSAVSAERITLEKYVDYSGQYQGLYDNLEFVVVEDSNARLSGLLAGDSDVIEAVPYSSFNQLAENGTLNTEAVSGDERTFIWFHCGKAPFADVLARRAVLYAIDRDAITDSIYFGMADAAWAGQIRSNDPDYSEPTTPYRYDPEFAKELLSSANLTGPVPINIVLPSDTEHVWLQAPIIEANLREVGFEPTITPASSSAVVEQMVAGDFDISMLTGTTTNFSPTAELYLRLQYTADLPRTLTHWDTPELAKIEESLDAAQFAADHAEFEQLLGEVQGIVHDQVPFVSLHWFDHITSWRDQVEFHPLPLRGLFRECVQA